MNYNTHSTATTNPNKKITVIMMVMVICVLISAVMLCGRLGLFASQDGVYATIITVNEDIKPNKDTKTEGADGSTPDSNSGEGTIIEKLDAEMITSDNDGVWETETDIEIFKLRYINGENQITVNGQERLIAPGTENTYSFMLENTGEVPVSYNMEMEAYISNNVDMIPVTAKVYDHNGRYLAGTETSWTPVLDINNVKDSGELAPEHYWDYTLEWQWPFEGDDVYDTFLGNKAVDEDITLTVVIKTHAEAEDTVIKDGGIPKTGDDFGMILWVVLMGAAIVILMVCLFARRKKEETADEQ